jgi:tetratricopeptide (TPR) repeat protein
MDATFGIGFYSDDREMRLASAEASARRALSLARGHALGHVVLGAVYVHTGRAEESIAEFERAIELDRNLALAHSWIGAAKAVLGRGAETEAHIKEALRLSPRDPLAYSWFAIAGAAKLCLGAHEEALAWLRRSIEVNHNYEVARFYQAAALAHLGHIEEARSSAKAGLALDPAQTIRHWRGRIAGGHDVFAVQMEHIIDGLRIAGVPEE